MPLQHFKVLSFDVVGTLIDFERGMLDYVHQVAPATTVDDDAFLAAYRLARGSADATWYLEAKFWRVALQAKHRDQALSYARRNGRRWRIRLLPG